MIGQHFTPNQRRGKTPWRNKPDEPYNEGHNEADNEADMGDRKKVFQCDTCGSRVNSLLGYQRHAESHQPITLEWVCWANGCVKMCSARPGRETIADIWRCSTNTLVTSRRERCASLTRSKQEQLTGVGGRLAMRQPSIIKGRSRSVSKNWRRRSSSRVAEAARARRGRGTHPHLGSTAGQGARSSGVDTGRRAPGGGHGY